MIGEVCQAIIDECEDECLNCLDIVESWREKEGFLRNRRNVPNEYLVGSIWPSDVSEKVEVHSSTTRTSRYTTASPFKCQLLLYLDGSGQWWILV